MFEQSAGSFIISLPDQSTLRLDMTKVYAAERRRHEVALVNSHRAPELLAAYNEGYAELNDHLAKLEVAKNKATTVMDTRRAIVILDLVPAILVQKGLSTARNPGGSEDLRSAILSLDAEYLAAKDRVEMIEALIKLLEGKRKSVENDYTSVKKILGTDDSWKDSGVNRNRNMSVPSELPASLEAGQVYEPNKVYTVEPTSTNQLAARKEEKPLRHPAFGRT